MAPTADDGATVVATRRWLVKVPFNEEIAWGSGRRDGATRLVVELETADGTRGYGETICLLDFIPAVLDKCVLPLVMGKPAHAATDLARHAFGAGYYHHKRSMVMALCAVEMAMWDATAKRAGMPLHQLWGGACRTAIDMSAYLFANEAATLAAKARAFQERGYREFKVKIGLDPASDIGHVKVVRETIGAGVTLRADVNGAWTLGTAKRQLARLAEHDLAYIEQPLEVDDLLGSAELRLVQPVPVALDESAYTLADVANIVACAAADVVLLDPHEQGGLWPCLKAAAVCEGRNIPVTLHSGGELGLSQAAYLHLAAAIPNMTIAVDTERDYLAADIVAEDLQVRDGRMAVPLAPGLGVTPDLEAIERHQVTAVTGAYLDPQRPGWYPVKPAY